MTECDPLKNPIYPINTLRRLAINNICTSHFVNLDMDLWPSCPFSRQLSWLVRLYEGLQRIDAATANADRVAFVLPAFQFTPKVREICKTQPDCFAQLKGELPSSKTELLACMHKQVCQIANAFLPTHVSGGRSCSLEAFRRRGVVARATPRANPSLHSVRDHGTVRGDAPHGEQSDVQRALHQLRIQQGAVY